MKACLRSVSRLLRTRLLRSQLAHLGENARLDRRVRLDEAGKIGVGAHCEIESGVILRANSVASPAIVLGNHVSIKEYTVVNANRGSVTIGDRSWIGPHCLLYGNGNVCIGRDVLIAAQTCINTVSHGTTQTDCAMNLQPVRTDPVNIQDDVWIGLHCSILQGVTIGRGSVIGAGAVVTRDIPPWSIAVGVPARIVGSRAPLTQVAS